MEGLREDHHRVVGEAGKDGHLDGDAPMVGNAKWLDVTPSIDLPLEVAVVEVGGRRRGDDQQAAQIERLTGRPLRQMLLAEVGALGRREGHLLLDGDHRVQATAQQPPPAPFHGAHEHRHGKSFRQQNVHWVESFLVLMCSAKWQQQNLPTSGLVVRLLDDLLDVLLELAEKDAWQVVRRGDLNVVQRGERHQRLLHLLVGRVLGDDEHHLR